MNHESLSDTPSFTHIDWFVAIMLLGFILISSYVAATRYLGENGADIAETAILMIDRNEFREKEVDSSLSSFGLASPTRLGNYLTMGNSAALSLQFQKKEACMDTLTRLIPYNGHQELDFKQLTSGQRAIEVMDPMGIHSLSSLYEKGASMCEYAVEKDEPIMLHYRVTS